MPEADGVDDRLVLKLDEAVTDGVDVQELDKLSDCEGTFESEPNILEDVVAHAVGEFESCRDAVVDKEPQTEVVVE